MKVSIVVNCDTRDGFLNSETSAEHMFDGCKSKDFLTHGIRNKIKFFDGFDHEVILYVDEHGMIDRDFVEELHWLADSLVIRSHTSENNFNDYNYLRALFMASGDIICHVDQDTACFASSQQSVQNLIDLLNDFSFVSYPSHWSPRAVHDESFGKRTWASTRFFLCKRETLKWDVLLQCLKEPEWAYQTFGDSPRRLNWLEHFLSLANSDSVYYPPMNLDQLAIFSWKNYRSGVLKELNGMNYEGVKNFINNHGGIVYPNDLAI